MGGVKKQFTPGKKNERGGVERRMEGVAMKVLLFVVCNVWRVGGRWGKDWKRLASHTKNVFFLPAFPQGKGTLGERRNRWQSALTLVSLFATTYYYYFVSSYRTLLVLEHPHNTRRYQY